MKSNFLIFVLASTVLFFVGCETTADTSTSSNSSAPFGGEEDVNYANSLWQIMEANKLVGSNSIKSTPYPGIHPHGAILDTFETTLDVSGHNGELIIKNNYGGEGVSKESVANDPDKWLKAVTVMYRREVGYDPDDHNWFWVKYAPDGSVLTNPKGAKLAGRVAKGKPKGCIACHKTAPGGDMVFKNDR